MDIRDMLAFLSSDKLHVRLHTPYCECRDHLRVELVQVRAAELQLSVNHDVEDAS
jgi:hypothetical protein